MQLAQLREKFFNSKQYLEQSNNLSQIINSGINLLELRKQRTIETINMFQDIVQLRSSFSQVQEYLDKGDLESSINTMGAKCLVLMKVLEQGGQIKKEDTEVFN